MGFSLLFSPFLLFEWQFGGFAGLAWLGFGRPGRIDSIGLRPFAWIMEVMIGVFQANVVPMV